MTKKTSKTAAKPTGFKTRHFAKESLEATVRAALSKHPPKPIKRIDLKTTATGAGHVRFKWVKDAVGARTDTHADKAA